MLKRFYITLTLWFLSICALGLFARSSPDGLAIVLMGILPLGFSLILMLLYYVPRETVPPLAEASGSVVSQATGPQASLVVDWCGKAAIYPVEPHNQFNAIELRPGRPALRLVHSCGVSNACAD